MTSEKDSDLAERRALFAELLRNDPPVTVYVEMPDDETVLDD